MKKVKISIFTTKWGHRSIADAVKDVLDSKKQYHIFLNDIQIDSFSEKSYIPFYRLFPGLFKYTIKPADNKNGLKLVKKYLKRAYKSRVEKLIAKQNPDVVISTYLGFNPGIEELLTTDRLFINIIPDPLTFHKIEVSNLAYNLVFDTKAQKRCLSMGCPPEKIVNAGWFVRDKYNQNYSITKERKKLGISGNDFVILAVSGSDGSYSVLKTIPSLIGTRNKITVIFICGKSKSLFNSVKALSQIPLGKNLKIKTVGFTDKLYTYIQSADVVIGKAGPNLLFETVAIGKPFIAISHISGQEDGNLEIIKNYKLGFVEENPLKLVKLIKSISDNPNKLKQYKHHLLKTANYIKGSGEILNSLISEKIGSLEK